MLHEAYERRFEIELDIDCARRTEGGMIGAIALLSPMDDAGKRRPSTAIEWREGAMELDGSAGEALVDAGSVIRTRASHDEIMRTQAMLQRHDQPSVTIVDDNEEQALKALHQRMHSWTLEDREVRTPKEAQVEVSLMNDANRTGSKTIAALIEDARAKRGAATIVSRPGGANQLVVRTTIAWNQVAALRGEADARVRLIEVDGARIEEQNSGLRRTDVARELRAVLSEMDAMRARVDQLLERVERERT